MNSFLFCCLAAVALATRGVKGGAVGKDEEVLDTCMDGKHHKTTPGPEGELYRRCSPWKDRSCCTNDTAYKSHQNGVEGLYNFNYSHCARVKEMSTKCHDRFAENNCFYECSPNVGPWTVPEGNSFRNEKYVDVPLCRDVANAWWYDCRSDYTCKKDWSAGWDWTSGTNECPTGSECKLFSEIFPTPDDLINIFPGDYVIANQSEPCMVHWFEGENPNDEVARYYAKEMGLCCGAMDERSSSVLSLFVAFLAYLWNKLF